MFVREQVAKPNLGKDADRWMGLLLTIFLTVLVWNLMGVIPFIQFPVAAHIAFPFVLAVSVYVIKVYLGVKHHGVRGYLKGVVYLDGPARLGLRHLRPDDPRRDLRHLAVHALHPVFANMFAGHLLLAFFSSVGFWFLFERLTVLGAGIGVLGVAMTMILTAFEISSSSCRRSCSPCSPRCTSPAG